MLGEKKDVKTEIKSKDNKLKNYKNHIKEDYAIGINAQNKFINIEKSNYFWQNFYAFYRQALYEIDNKGQYASPG